MKYQPINRAEEWTRFDGQPNRSPKIWLNATSGRWHIAGAQDRQHINYGDAYCLNSNGQVVVLPAEKFEQLYEPYP